MVTQMSNLTMFKCQTNKSFSNQTAEFKQCNNDQQDNLPCFTPLTLQMFAKVVLTDSLMLFVC